MRVQIDDTPNSQPAEATGSGGTPGERAALPAPLRVLRNVEPPPSLVAGVMRRIADPAPPTFLTWLTRRRRLEFRFSISPLGASLLMASIIVATVGLTALPIHLTRTVPSVATSPPSRHAAQSPSAPSPEIATTITVRFVLNAEGARRVAVAGDFNGWDTERTLLAPMDAAGTFAASVNLPRGAHEYMFVVDGAWVTDPAATERRPDGFGHDNAVLRL